MNRYTYFEYKPGWFKPARVYKLLYTLEAISFLEFRFNVSVYDIQAIKADSDSLAWLLYAGLLACHPDITFDACKIIALHDFKSLFKVIDKALTNALPKREANEGTSANKEDVVKNHWQYWLECVNYVGLSPKEAEKLTPNEVYEAVKVANEKFKTYRRLTAWHLASIMNMFSKKRITVEKLLGEEDPLEPMDDNEFDELWEARLEYAKTKEALTNVQP